MPMVVAWTPHPLELWYTCFPHALSLDLGGVSRAMLIRKDKPGVGGKALLMPERLLAPLCFNIIAINANLAETAETYLEFSNFITLR